MASIFPEGYTYSQYATDLEYIAKMLQGGPSMTQSEVSRGNPFELMAPVAPTSAPRPEEKQKAQEQTQQAQPVMSEQDRLRSALASLAYMLGGFAQAFTPQWSWQSQLGAVNQRIAQQQLTNLMLKYMNQGGQAPNPTKAQP